MRLHQKEKISGTAEEIYNTYLLLYKLNEIKVDSGKSLQDIIVEAITQGKTQAEFKVKGNSYKVNIIKKGGSYELGILGEHTKPEAKDILKYTDEEIIALWADSKVSFEKDPNNNRAFAVGLHDQSRLQDLKVGGLGKKVPFALRFANFYKVIEVLKDEGTPLEERLRIANNIATGSGKTGDIALLKFWAYLTNIPCVTAVPSDNLRNQSNNFDRAFLPDEVAQEFAEPFSETNAEYATSTFTEAFNTQWNLLNDKYGKNKSKPALILIDEAPKLKENAVQMARAVEVSRGNPTAFFSATPDKFLSEEFKIKQQILLSPKEREALGIGKLPVVYYHKMKFKNLEEMVSAKGRGKSTYELRFVNPEIAYTEKSENTHTRLNQYKDAVAKFISEITKQNGDLSKLSQPFLDFISKSLDSQAYKKGLIGTEERWAENVKNYITEGRKDDAQERRKKRIESFVKVIKDLNIGLTENNIRCLVEENLNVEIGSKLLPSIKLHNILDTLDEYKKSGRAVNKDEISKFIDEKYEITDSSSLEFNSELTDAILKLHKLQSDQGHKKSTERNYPGDKKLHEHIFNEFPKIKKFCEQDAVICCFNGSVKRFKSNGEQIYQYIDDMDKKNILSIIKAGFVPNTISKELALGIDAPRLSRAAAIVKDKTEMLDPMFLLQLMGRVGRDAKSKGSCYFDMFTSDESCLKVDEITTLSGANLITKLEEGHENYIRDGEGNIKTCSALLEWDIKQIIVLYDLNPHLQKEQSLRNAVAKRIKSELSNLSIQYRYDKKAVISVFTGVLKRSTSNLERTFNTQKVNLENVRRLGACVDYAESIPLNDAALKELEESIKGLKGVVKQLEQVSTNALEYSDDMSLADWARYIVHTKPMSHEDLLKADPNSRAPIFMEQKERSQRRCASVHNASESIGTPSTASKSFQQVSTKKKIMYGVMIASPFIAVGIYALVVGAAVFDPVVAAGIFVGAVVTAAILFGAVKIYEKKAENPDMEVGTAVKQGVLNKLCQTEKKVIN
ncbi:MULTISPECIES: DEAD/DEAH box helicase family protein [unclassified Wolbachia]|uniref:hypothetical protein n=1 Tax=unclassified Wolbachia TaxID=2640676 RepID=UPI00222E192E|nr:hypothetical protein [Wolbachia endosymbiont (group A) of Andrena dorsata]